jgi:hypothetical protein
MVFSFVAGEIAEVTTSGCTANAVSAHQSNDLKK